MKAGTDRPEDPDLHLGVITFPLLLLVYNVHQQQDTTVLITSVQTSEAALTNNDKTRFINPDTQAPPPTCVVWLSAELFCHGATLPGRENRTLPSLTTSSDTKVTLMRTVAPGGRFPTLMVNTSYGEKRGDVRAVLEGRCSLKTSGCCCRTYRSILVHEVRSVASLYSTFVLPTSRLLLLHLRTKTQRALRFKSTTSSLAGTLVPPESYREYFLFGFGLIIVLFSKELFF